MTVKEMIKILQGYNPDAIVFVDDNQDNYPEVYSVEEDSLSSIRHLVDEENDKDIVILIAV